MNTNHIYDTSFEESKSQKREAVEAERYEEEKRRSWIQFWIPVVISLTALFRPEIISFIKYLATLLTNK